LKENKKNKAKLSINPMLKDKFEKKNKLKKRTKKVMNPG